MGIVEARKEKEPSSNLDTNQEGVDKRETSLGKEES